MSGEKDTGIIRKRLLPSVNVECHYQLTEVVRVYRDAGQL